jgi:hypothetical protein
MTAALIYLDRDANPGKLAEFNRVATDLSIRFDTVAHGLHDGATMLRVAELFDPLEVDHLIVVSHGFTTRLLSAEAGVHVTRRDPPAVVSLEAFADAWAPVLALDCKVSLCACMCSRSPSSSWRKLLGGRVISDWDPLVHEDGGADSFSACLRDALLTRGRRATVRGHTTAAHVTNNPACREHGPERGAPGRSLFNIALDPLGVHLAGSFANRTGSPAAWLRAHAADWPRARRFNNLVKGELATRWILFDDTAVEDIRARW